MPNDLSMPELLARYESGALTSDELWANAHKLFAIAKRVQDGGGKADWYRKMAAHFAAYPLAEVLVCDGCGACYPDDEDSLSESCDVCGRFKQRMEFAKPADIVRDASKAIDSQSVRLAELEAKLTDVGKIAQGAVARAIRLDRDLAAAQRENATLRERLGEAVPFVESWALTLEAEVDYEYSHTEAQKSICGGLQEANDWLAKARALSGKETTP